MKGILHIAWNRWKIITQQIGDFNGRLLMTVFYFTILLFFGLRFTLLADPLRIKKPDFGPARQPRRPVGESLEAARRQF